MGKTYAQYRAQIYASTNATKGNLMTLSKSKLLSKKEKEKLLVVVSAMEDFRVEFFNNRGKGKEIANCGVSGGFCAEQDPTGACMLKSGCSNKVKP